MIIVCRNITKGKNTINHDSLTLKIKMKTSRTGSVKIKLIKFDNTKDIGIISLQKETFLIKVPLPTIEVVDCIIELLK